MKILSVELENFASYEILDFNFNDQGLTLIHGATGSGKSTLMDAIPWVLFGITAKNGKADDVVSWNGGETFGTILLEVNGKSVQISRSRKPNDLYFRTEDNLDANPTRGKDLTDTQKLINELLGMNADLYLAGAYFHEFSQTAQFFTTTPKNRRSITENLVDLSLPTTLQEKLKINIKDLNAQLTVVKAKQVSNQAKVDAISEMIIRTEQQYHSWANTKANEIAVIQTKADNFESKKQRDVRSLQDQILNNLQFENSGNIRLVMAQHSKTDKCDKCGKSSHNELYTALEKQLEQALRREIENEKLKSRIEEIKASENVYQNQVTDLKNQTNPHTSNLLKLEADFNKFDLINQKQKAEVNGINEGLLNLELLQDVTTKFRAELVSNTITKLKDFTISHLRDYFDGEITVDFNILDSEKLEVTIQKDGNECSFTQLSKGQRQILKLCFGVAVMQCIQETHSLDVKQLFFDESLDGMDDNFKLKAVKMLETIATIRDSVYIVEHSETVKAQIDQKYFVELINGKSVFSNGI